MINGMRLLKNNVSEKGKVSYSDFSNNKTELRDYINSLTSNPPTEKWMKDHKLDFLDQCLQCLNDRFDCSKLST